MAKTIIRIPRTTALFVTGLGRALRDHLGFSITEHEHWTFEHVAKWSQCGSKGHCIDHGISDKAYAEFVKQEGTGPWPDYDHHYSYFYPCYAYQMSVYLATGQARVRGKVIELRVRIEESRADYMDPDEAYYIARIWVCDEAGTVTKGEFGLHNNGAFATNESMPNQPPRRIAFSCQNEEVAVSA